jgi:hypothetical protein
MHAGQAMTPRTSRTVSRTFLRAACMAGFAMGFLTGAAHAQDGGGPDECARAATLVRAYDQAAINSGGRASQGEGKTEQRQIAVTTLMGCGALGGTAASSTILATRMLTDTSVLEELVGPFRYFRDTAVVNAISTVASDASSSVEALVFALRAVWVLRTGKFWIQYHRMLPTSESTPADPIAACDDGLSVTEKEPYWITGIAPSAGFEEQLRVLASQLFEDASQPMAVRAAARCARRP